MLFESRDRGFPISLSELTEPTFCKREWTLMEETRMHTNEETLMTRMFKGKQIRMKVPLLGPKNAFSNPLPCRL